MPKKETTIDDLAIMVQKGFIGVDKRFDSIDKKFKVVDKRFDEVSQRLIKIERKDDVKWLKGQLTLGEV